MNEFSYIEPYPMGGTDGEPEPRESVVVRKVMICPICGSKILVSWNFPIEKCYCVDCDKEIIPLSTPQEVR